jgi:hypothetical protein
MTSFANNPTRYLLFAALLVYATTGDFMATSVFSDGGDCDHPCVRIEHKCVTESSRIKHVDRSPAIITWTAIPSALVIDVMTQAGGYFQDRDARTFENTEISQELVPLRC